MGRSNARIAAALAALVAVIAIWYVFFGSSSNQGGSASVTGAWNAADKNPGIVLSNDGKTATQSGAKQKWAAVRGGAGKSVGQWYFRLKIDAVDTDAGWVGGVASAATPLNDFIGDEAHAAGFQVTGNFWQSAKNNPNAWSGASPGNTIIIAVDVDSKKIWASVDGSGVWNGSPGNSPSAGTGGLDISAVGKPVFPAWSGYNGSTADAATIDTVTKLSDPPLAGFANWGG
jgi:hypothetical protein